jgi:hypothetical protein
MWIGIYVTGRFHDQFEIQCKLYQVKEVDVMTYFEFICGYEQMIQDAVLTILRCTHIGKYVKKCCHDLNWSAMWTGKDLSGWFHDQYELVCGLEQMIKDNVMS